MYDLATKMSKNNMIAVILLIFGKFFGIMSAGAIFGFREFAPLFLTLYGAGVFGSISVAIFEMYNTREEDA